jgi:pyrroline-5-carboxylate reductase
MKIAIIGAGNMGMSIVRGLYESGLYNASDLFVSDVNQDNLDSIKKIDKDIFTTTDNKKAILSANYILLAVKPWLIDEVIVSIKPALNTVQHAIISIAAGVDLATIAQHAGNDFTFFRVLPNTAISIRESMTFVSSLHATREQEEAVLDLFGRLGKAIMVPESTMEAFTSISSCGIAYALRYIRAATQGSVELGIKPELAQEVIAQTMIGAAELILQNKTNPETEIDKVTTPGGWTIKGLNAMEENGFSNAVIKGIKANGR